MATVRIQEMPRQQRKTRSPNFPFHLRTYPYQIQPFMCAPVLPGETMKNLTIQSRVVTDPLQNPLIGWHKEYYFFYVKLRDLSIRDALQEMVLTPAYDNSAIDDPTSDVRYNFIGAAGAMNWAKLCLQRVTEVFFRNNDEAWDAYVIDTLPIAQISGESALNSVTNEDPYEAVDLNVDINANATITASEVERALRLWQYQQMNNLTSQSFDEYLATHGIKVNPEEQHEPELIRVVKEWTYPANTVEPTTGVPTSACSWSIRDRADKDRFFREPGFVLGVTVSRPKVYLTNYRGQFSSWMNDAYSWLPAVLRDDVRHAHKEFAAGAGPLNGITDGYYVDLRDVLLYGEQFTNVALTTSGIGGLALPTAALQKRYAPSLASVQALFTDSSGTNGRDKIREDGVVSMNVLSSVHDLTPRN